MTRPSKRKGKDRKAINVLPRGNRFRESGISGQKQIIGSIKVKGIGRFGAKQRYFDLRREAESYGCSLEFLDEARRKRGYTFTSEDTGLAGVFCLTLDEVDEELDNFRG